MWKDVSMPLTAEIPVYPGDQPFSMTRTKVVGAAEYVVSSIAMSLHNGTHIDAPAHFIEDGKTIDQMPPRLMVGPCQVTDRIESIMPGCTRVFLRQTEGLTPEEALRLVEQRVMLIGVNRMSIARRECEAEVHRILLSAGCWLVENVCLDTIPHGVYACVCTPIAIAGAEAAPARVLLDV